MHCQSCKNHYVFPMISSTPAMPAQCSRMPRPTKGCAQLLCPKAPHRSCPNTMCKLCCIDRMGGCIAPGHNFAALLERQRGKQCQSQLPPAHNDPHPRR
ncbi:hypothetical protein L208DRAFT_1513601, partial [Tricholoma matsutake]